MEFRIFLYIAVGYPSQKACRGGASCIKTGIRMNLEKKMRENWSEKPNLTPKYRRVWTKTPKRFRKNSLTFEGKRKGVWGQMYLCFWKVVFRAAGGGWKMWILGVFFCGMGGLECENGGCFLYVFACVLWRICVVYFLFVIAVVIYLNIVSFWICINVFPC